MKQGQRYRIITKPSGNLKSREMVFSFLSETESEYSFSARPLAGTQDIPKRDILEMYETDAKIMLPRIWRGEVRVL